MQRVSRHILEIDDLSVSFHTEDGVVAAVRNVSFSVPDGKTVALLGESGCGKTVTASAILHFVDAPGRIESGSVRLRANLDAGNPAAWLDLLQLDPNGERIRNVRWNAIAMIFQDPARSMTPAYTVGEQMIEAIRTHRRASRAEARERALHLLEEVGISAPQRRLRDYPHQLSGGMCQRVMIAMALCCEPRLLIADEPTTALDATIQAQVLDLLKTMQEERGTSILLITHDMGVVAEMADEVVVMYLGRVAERGSVRQIFDRPAHPYTRRLFDSVPRPGASSSSRLPGIPGSVPDALHVPEGCPFRGRCSEEMDVCRNAPRLHRVEAGHDVACFLHEEAEA